MGSRTAPTRKPPAGWSGSIRTIRSGLPWTTAVAARGICPRDRSRDKCQCRCHEGPARKTASCSFFSPLVDCVNNLASLLISVREVIRRLRFAAAIGTVANGWASLRACEAVLSPADTISADLDQPFAVAVDLVLAVGLFEHGPGPRGLDVDGHLGRRALMTIAGPCASARCTRRSRRSPGMPTSLRPEHDLVAVDASSESIAK